MNRCDGHPAGCQLRIAEVPGVCLVSRSAPSGLDPAWLAERHQRTWAQRWTSDNPPTQAVINKNGRILFCERTGSCASRSCGYIIRSPGSPAEQPPPPKICTGGIRLQSTADCPDAEHKHDGLRIDIASVREDPRTRRSDVADGSGFAISLGPLASLGARPSDKLSPSAPSVKESRYGIARAPLNFERR
ncbi:hypothetical protein VTN02DRAFT_4741 [Thermoascus thermophilus]